MTNATRRFNEAQEVAATAARNFSTFLLMEQFAAKEIGARIQIARKERGMTQEDLAALAPFSKRSLQDYEAGETIPYKHLSDISRLLGRPTEWFLYGGDDADELTPGDGEETQEAMRTMLERVEETLSEVRDMRAEVDRRLAALEAPPADAATGSRSRPG